MMVDIAKISNIFIISLISNILKNNMALYFPRDLMNKTIYILLSVLIKQN